MPGYVHHVQWCVARNNWDKCINKLKCFGFKPVAEREGEVVLRVGATYFLISEHESNVEKAKLDSNSHTYPHFTCGQNLHQEHIERVFNVCLEVENVENIHHKMIAGGCSEVMEPTIINKMLTVSSVTAPCENVLHVLVNTSNISDGLLPGFESVSQEDEGEGEDDVSLTHTDHITYVCRTGESQGILEWYKDVCGMKNFPVKRNQEEERLILNGKADESLDDEDFCEDGALHLKGIVGMRLQAGAWMSEWLCKEDGVETESSNQRRNFKLVLAEPLEGHPQSHVLHFLHHNGGPGVQHIGLLSDGIEQSVAAIVKKGFPFRRPPPTYYSLEKKVAEFKTSGLSLETCRRLGVLIDREVGDNKDDSNVLQIFSQPIFPAQDTFFLEVIQRNGDARGFGSGNISALALSIIEFNKQNV